MDESRNYQIITFYKFKDLGADENLNRIRKSLRDSMRENSILGTIVLAGEGYNSTVSGAPENIEKFVREVENILGSPINYKSSYHDEQPFGQIKVKVKREIVTLKKSVAVDKAGETHAKVSEWNRIISDPETFVLDARNDYEFQVGTFANAVNPQTARFSDLPTFVEKNLDPKRHKKIAMFCTGGVRCEKFAPYLKDLGFETVYQLSGGILQYLEETPPSESLWTGECFVFDRRTTVDERLEKGCEKDLSVEAKALIKSNE